MTTMTPIIMDSDINVVSEKLITLRKRKIDKVHIDIGDGIFSDWLSVAPADMQQLNITPFKVDIHLLVDDPTEWIEECVALSPTRLIGHIEHMGSQALFLETINSYGGNTKGGLALESYTEVESIEKDILESCETILLLAVPAGTTGSKFDFRIIEKIKKLRKIYKGNIVVDGGINDEIETLVIQAGASEVAINSYYWKNKFS